jgi:exoribonuclease R
MQSPTTTGVLILKNNRTYGRYKNNPKNKLLYKCVPNDRSMDTVLVPYEMKRVGFSKSFANLYVTFHIETLNDDAKGHHIAKLDSTIGQVDVLAHYYEYQLLCHKITEPISAFTRATAQAIKHMSVELDPNSSVEQSPRILTIDPGGSTDFDDAVNIETLVEAEGRSAYKITIYIADVPSILTRMDTWEHVSDRVATVYLPKDADQSKKPMLPPVLSDDICSLIADKLRDAFALELTIIDNEIVGTVFNRVQIRVAKNYQYESRALLRDPDYIKLLSVTRKMCVMPDQKYIAEIVDSHDVVAYLMILMNCVAARALRAEGTGIFRAAPGQGTEGTENEPTAGVTCPTKSDCFACPTKSDCFACPTKSDCFACPVAAQFFRSGGAAQYVNIETIPSENQDVALRHAALNATEYIHITSPIRRLADLLNMTRLQRCLGLITKETESRQSEAFYNKWIARIDHINERMTSIRKVQNDCALVAAVAHEPEILENDWDAYVCDIDPESRRVSVFIPRLKLVARAAAPLIETDNELLPSIQTKVQCRIHLFQDEDRVRRKVRVSLNR